MTQKQLAQKLKKGIIEIREMPLPALEPGRILVANRYSLISAGTEASTVSTARKSLLGKARARPDQVRQVLEVLRTQGPVQTYRAVMKKLDAYSPLGYSSAGEVIGVGEGVRDFAVGDFVACAGNTANHAEIVSVPVNLAVRLDPEADLAQAAYNTLGAIAMQGIRRAELSFGESCAVIGLGLIGQLTGLMLRAAGIRAFGIDIDPRMVEITLRNRAFDHAWARNTPGLSREIVHLTDGLGVDAVIIAAGTSSLDPVNFAGEISRKRGRVVVVGAVPTGFDRDPHYYRKELDLVMSCSYGPGRYDPDYEEKGHDYPPAWVRWTERRNMAAFQRMISEGRIDLASLTTHVFPLEQAAEAYELVLSRREPFLGVLLEYARRDEAPEAGRRIAVTAAPKAVGGGGIGFIGAGSYAQGFLLPNLPAGEHVPRRGIATSSGTTSRRVAERFGFAFCTDDPDAVINDAETDTVFIVTRHDSHSRYVRRALEAGKNVYVEKPLCLDEAELVEIEELLEGLDLAPRLMVGFNRRFAPLIMRLKDELTAVPLAAVYRVNAGAIPPDSWIQDPQVGGGRIIGEGCHFVDLLVHLTGSLPVEVHAVAMDDPHGLHDTVSITLRFANGSVGTVHYFANGPKGMEKEKLEVFQSGRAFVLDDFRELVIHDGGKPRRHRAMVQNKGQKAMLRAFFDALEQGAPAPIPFTEIRAVTAATLAAELSLKNRAPVRIR